jgi:hypothetical protein
MTDEHSDFNPNDFMYSPPMLETVKTANEFCLLTEQAKSGNKKVFIVEALKKISLLYAQLMNLEVPENLPAGETQKFVSEADWTYIEGLVKSSLGGDNRLTELREPENPGETIETELSECFADIYQSFKDFILLYELAYEEAAKASIGELKQLFNFHTGPRMLLLMSELHDLIHGSQELSEDEIPPSEMQKNENRHKDSDRWIDDFFVEDKKS